MKNVTVVNGIFSPGISTDAALVAVQNPFGGNSTRQWNSFNVTGDDASFPKNGNRTFSISPTDNRNIREFMRTVFASTVDDPFGLALYNSSNLIETLNMIGTSMTYAMGQSPTGEKLVGQAMTTEQYISVKWAWISLPLIEVTMGIALLACTLIHTRRRRVIAWKSSSIVPLFTVISGWNSGDLGAASWRQVQKRAEGMRGILVPYGDDMQTFIRTG